MRRIRLTVSVLTVLLFAAALPAGGELCAVDQQPAATLLLPYFEVDLKNPAGMTTVFTVNNISSQSVWARAVLWTDAANPTLGFDLYLTGYDVQSVNLRDVFAGRLPATGPEGSPHGAQSGPPLDACRVPGATLPFDAYLREAHTGQPSSVLEGLCAGFDHGDEVARGYVTIDVVEGCTLGLPSDEGYFGEGGSAAYDNVLWGDFLFLETGADNARGDNLVSLEADPERFGPGDLTFYGPYVGYSGADAREPLPSQWANRYVMGGGLGITSRSIVWRSTGAPPELFDCPVRPFRYPPDPGGPSWYPLDTGETLSFNEREDVVFWSTDVAYVRQPDPHMPAATQSVPGRRAFSSGWELVDLNPSSGERLQSYLMESMEARGRYSLMRPAMPLDSGCSVEGCIFGAAEIGQVCVRSAESVSFVPGNELVVELRPRGCFSSSCTIVYRALCEVRQVGPSAFAAEGSFCLRELEGVCTEDCGGGGQARCSLPGGLAEGDYTLTAGGLGLAFSVPSELPPEGLCSGDPLAPVVE